MNRSFISLVMIVLLVVPGRRQEITDTVATHIRIRNAVAFLGPSGQVRITPEIFGIGSKDKSGMSSLTVSREVFGCSDMGEHTILITGKDVGGNITTVIALLTIKDTIPPNVITRNQVSLKLDPSGRITPDPTLFDNGSTDACGIREMSIDPASFSCMDLGKRRILFTVTDRNGNSASMPVLVTITSDFLPAMVPANMTLEIDAGGKAVLDTRTMNIPMENPCGLAEISVDPSVFGCNNLGDNKVRFTASDRNGNTAISETLIKVVDLIPPMAVARDQLVLLNENGTVSVDAAAVDAGSYDNCGISNRTVEPSVFDCSHIGINKIILTVTDHSGNKSTAEASVIVEDLIPPVLATQELRLQVDPEGNVMLPEKLIQMWGRDNCGIPSVDLEISTLDCSAIGTQEVKVTSKDNSGNISSKPVKVIVEDKIPPEVRTRNITIKLNEKGTATLEPGDINNGSSDNCSIKTMTVNREEFTRGQLGKNEVELTVVDASGNKSTDKAIVTVVSE